MSMIHLDGFDYLTTGNFVMKWDNAASGMNIVGGIYGKGKALNISSLTVVTKTVPANTTGMVGFHIFVGSLVAQKIFTFMDAGTTQVDLRIDTSGGLFFTRNGTTIGSTSTIKLNTTNQWYWIEVQVTIDGSAGVANLYINGVSALAQTGLVTNATSHLTFNQVGIIGTNGIGITNVDSFHYWDTTAGDVSGFPYGEHIIDMTLATGVGGATSWTNSGAATNFGCVNEANEDGDSTYVATNTSNNIDTYAFANLSETAGTIGTIAVNAIARADDGMSHVMQLAVNSTGTSTTSSNVSPGASYNNYQAFFGTDPHTSSAWTIAGRNAAFFGEKLIV
jgi:hypothetical protein